MVTQVEADSNLVVCPACHAVVRVPVARTAEHPHCARCKSELFTGQPVALDAQSFPVHTERSNVPVLVDFWAEWCGPCLRVAPVLEEIAREMGDKVKIVKLDIDANPNVARDYRIMSVPTLTIFKGGTPVQSVAGARPKSDLVKLIESAL